MRKKISGLLLLLCVCVFIHAQEYADSLYFNLDEVVVVKSKTVKEVVPVQELKGEELQKLNAYSVADALRFFSGVQLKDYGGIGGLKTINVRSMGSEHLGVFYDGIEIGNAQNGVVDLGRYSLDNMEAVSLYNGQKSNIFQSAKDFASASSVYMTTKSPDFQNERKTNMRFAFRTGAFDLINPTAVWEQQLNNNLTSSFNAEYTKSSGKYKYRYKKINNLNDGGGYDTTAIRQNGDIQILRLEQALFGKISGGEWKTRLYFYKSERGYPGAIIKGVFKHDDRQDDRNFFFQSSLKKRMSKVYSSQLLAKYAYDYIYYVSDDKKYQNTYKIHDVYLSSANMFNILPFWSANIAIDYQYNKMNSDIPEFIYPVRNAAWVAASSSLYWNKFKFQASMLYNYTHEQTHKDVKTDDQSNQTTGTHRQYTKKNYKQLTPSLVTSWQPFENENFYIRAFYKNTFRMPTFSEMYMAYMGNLSSFLRPENAKQYDLGIVYSKSITRNVGIEVQSDVYYNHIKDKLMAIAGGANFRWSMVNKGLVKIKGLDSSIAANYRVNDDLKFTGKLNYTYQDAKDYTPIEVQSDTISYKGQIPYIPWNSGTAIVNITYKNWDFNYSFVYTGKRYSSSANSPVTGVKEWYTNDLSISKVFRTRKLLWNATMEVNNLFNESYEVISGYPMPGTNFKFILRLVTIKK